jgi:hypothetical protein
MIIGICGRQGSGKDTTADMINQLTNNRFSKKRFSEPLKECAGIILGVPSTLFEDRDFKNSCLPKFDMTVREFLQKFGTEGVREAVHPNIWVEALFNSYDNQDWIIPDVRFINEADAVKSRGGILIKTLRNVKSDGHLSEVELDMISPDYEIANTGSFFDLGFNINKVLNDIGL